MTSFENSIREFWQLSSGWRGKVEVSETLTTHKALMQLRSIIAMSVFVPSVCDHRKLANRAGDLMEEIVRGASPEFEVSAQILTLMLKPQTKASLSNMELYHG